MKPEVGVPPAARRLFLASAPALVATWALGGLYLSLGPSLAIDLLGTDSHVGGALVIVALTGAGALISALARAVEPRLLVARGCLALLLGTAVTLVAVASDSTLLLYAGSVLAGGVAVDRYGLPDATYGYGAVVILLAAATAVAVWRGGPPSRLSPRAAR